MPDADRGPRQIFDFAAPRSVASIERRLHRQAAVGRIEPLGHRFIRREDFAGEMVHAQNTEQALDSSRLNRALVFPDPKRSVGRTSIPR